MEVIQSCFGTRNVLKFSFDNCIGCAMLVNSCVTIVEVVQVSFSTRNLLNPNFHNCRCQDRSKHLEIGPDVNTEAAPLN